MTQQTALKYLPYFYQDEQEPFPIKRIGYAFLDADGPSPSFRRYIALPENVQFVIEYAIFWDYDIQHLYDLEHAWVYVGADGEVINVEGSAHGWFLNMFRLGGPLEEQTHAPLYLQPGKHAMMPMAAFAQMYPDYLTACNQKAGSAGLLVTDLFKDKIEKPENADENVRRYVQKNYRFTPTLQYISSPVADQDVVPMDDLLEWIPVRIREVLHTITQAVEAEK